MIDAAALTADAARLVMEVENDLRSVLAADAGRDAQWREQHETALKGRRTSCAEIGRASCRERV